MRSSKYAKDCDGVIHAISAIFAEYTLCGNAFEGYSEVGLFAGDGEKRWREVGRGPVDCPQCIAQVLACRDIRIKRQ